jgi:putative ATPase
MSDSLLIEDSATGVYEPLAARMRPLSLSRFIGQEHILKPGKALHHAITSGTLHSMIFWGPPGVGKTTLARLIAHSSNSHFESLSAVLSGVKDIREAIERATHHKKAHGRQTILFVDEVHRFNKVQQDAFLPHIEIGTVLFIGATTENPAFAINNALLSRARTYVLKPLSEADLIKVIDQALHDAERGLGKLALHMDAEVKCSLVKSADGDARRALNLLEIASDFAVNNKAGNAVIDAAVIAQISQESVRRFDKGGDIFYQQVSALHKSLRGSDPDASLYWLTRMLDAGCDPLYIARRLLRVASEDIGNADPRALQLALACWDTFARLGSPEGELAIAQTVVYLACAPKSNAVYKAYSAVRESVERSGSLEVPLHLRNASTGLDRTLGYGEDYRYSHDETNFYSAGECYFPEPLAGSRFYFPADSGLEKSIREKLDYLRSLDDESGSKRYGKDRS